MAAVQTETPVPVKATVPSTPPKPRGRPAATSAPAVTPAATSAPAVTPAATSAPAVTPAVTVRKPKTATAPAVQPKPGPSGVTIETSQLVRAIGAIILGLGVIGLAIWWFGADFIMMALYVALPIFIIFVGFRLMGYGTLQLIWNGELKDRVMAYLGALEAANAK